MSALERLLPDPPDEVRALIGQRVRLRDVPSARGRVQAVVSADLCWVQWDGALYRAMEFVRRLERVS